MQLSRYVKFRDERFGGVLFETQGEKVFALNKTAAAILHELLAGYDVGAVVARLRGRFRDPSNLIEKDVETLIEQLQAKGLVTDSHSQQ